MTRKTWYRIALFLPVIVPLLGLSIAAPFAGWVDPVSHILSSLLRLGGAQYLIFAVALLWWGRNKTPDEINHLSWSLPFLFALIFALSEALIGILSGTFSISDPSVWIFSILLVPLAFFIAHFYLRLAHGLTWLLQKAGWIRD